MKTQASLIDEIDFSKLIPIEGDKTNLKFGKIIIETKNSNRRVEIKSEVRFYLQKYINVDNNLLIFNKKEFKNIYKRKIESMNSEEAIIRKCLLSLYDNQTAWMIVHKELDKSQYNIAIEEVKKEPSDNFLYYKFFIDSVYFDQPIEPKVAEQYHVYVKKFRDEIKYLISKNNFTECVKWANSIINKFFSPSKEIKAMFEKNNKIREDIKKEFKSIFLNQTYGLLKNNKQEKKKDYENIIEIAGKYRKQFNDLDKQFKKICFREAYCNIQIKEFDKVEILIKELETIVADEEDMENISFLKKESSNSKSYIKKKKFKLKFDIQDEVKYEYVWDNALRNIDLKSEYDYGIISIYK